MSDSTQRDPGSDRAAEDDDPPGGPWKSWPAIYATLAVWGVACILFLVWITGALNVGNGMAGTP